MKHKEKFEKERTRALVKLESGIDEPKEQIKNLMKDLKYERELHHKLLEKFNNIERVQR